MADEEEWERPIGLTKECAICVDDSDDDGESPSGDKRGISDGDQSKVASKTCASSLGHETRTGNAISSYFQSNRVASNSGSEGRDQKNGSGIIRTVDKSESPKTMANTAMEKLDDSPTELSIDKDDGVENDNPANTAMAKLDDSPTESSIDKEEDGVENDNPFASFAFVAEEASSSSSSLRPYKRPRENPSTNKPSHQQPSKKKNSIKVAKQKTKQEMQTHSFFSNTPSMKNAITIGPQEAQSRQLTQSEMADVQQKEKMERKQHRQELIAKWHAFADPKVPMEQRRFQLLVAARIHARCKEQMVTKAMDRLRTHFHEKDGLGSISCDVDAQSEEQTPRLPTQQKLTESATQPQSQQSKQMVQTSPHGQGLTVHSLAQCIPETEIAPLLSSVLFGNSKANQIVRAAQDVLTKFGGKVPESISSLKEITGIGPKLAEILSIVNRRETYS